MNEKRLKELVEKNKTIHLEDDDALQGIWNEMKEILTSNLSETIEYLDSINSDDLFYVKAVFDDLSEYFKSTDLISCMERNAIRTGMDCKTDIEYAIKALK